MASASAFRLTFFDRWGLFEGSECGVATTGCCGIGGDACGAGLFFEGFEKNPDPREGYPRRSAGECRELYRELIGEFAVIVNVSVYE